MHVQVTVYVSCYVEAQNRDAFMAVKQDLLLAFVDCVERNRAELARVRLSVRFPASHCVSVAQDSRAFISALQGTAQMWAKCWT